MNTSLFVKILELQKEIGAIPKDQINPFFKSRYFDINKLIEFVKPLLNKFGLVIIQTLSESNGKPALLTALIEVETGEKIEDRTLLPENPDAQKMGAIITYFRRYAIQSMLFLQAEDTDGNIEPRPELKPEPRYAPQPIKNDLPFEEKVEGAKCPDCDNGIIVRNPKTNKLFCDKKCWLPKV